MYEVRRFSTGDRKRKGKKYDKMIDEGLTIAGLGLIGKNASSFANGKAVDKLKEKLYEPASEKELDLYKKLNDQAEKKGIFVHKNAWGMEGGASDFRNDSVRNYTIKKLKKAGYSLEDLKNIDPVSYDVISNKKPYVTVSSKNPAVLAHEMGHIDFSGSKIGKHVQNPYLYQGLTGKPVQGGLLGASFASGINSAIKKSKGEDEEFVSKHAAWALPTLTHTPMLASEFEASRRGLKNLKSLGASKAVMAKSKKDLALAGASYLTKAGAWVGGNYAARGLGKMIGSSIAEEMEFEKNRKNKGKK